MRHVKEATPYSLSGFVLIRVSSRSTPHDLTYRSWLHANCSLPSDVASYGSDSCSFFAYLALQTKLVNR